MFGGIQKKNKTRASVPALQPTELFLISLIQKRFIGAIVVIIVVVVVTVIRAEVH